MSMSAVTVLTGSRWHSTHPLRALAAAIEYNMENHDELEISFLV